MLGKRDDQPSRSVAGGDAEGLRRGRRGVLGVLTYEKPICEKLASDNLAQPARADEGPPISAEGDVR